MSVTRDNSNVCSESGTGRVRDEVQRYGIMVRIDKDEVPGIMSS